MRSKYALCNGVISIFIFIINGIMSFMVRKVLLPSVGSEVVGLTATFTDVLAFLNLADLGISGCIGANLYEPISENNYSRIKGMLNLFKHMYKIFGLFFISSALIVAFILRVTFRSPKILSEDASLYFLLTAASIGLSYFFSYRLMLVATDQRMFRLKLVNMATKTASACIKIFVLVKFHSFYLFLITDVVFTFLYLILMNFLIKKAYHKSETAPPMLRDSDKHNIIKNVRGFMLHQIGSFAVFNTNSLYASVLSGLTSAALLSNYQMIVNVITGFLNSFFNGITSSIGNLIASKNSHRCYHIFRIIFMSTNMVAIICMTAFINSVQAFIAAFFGKQYVVNINVVYLLAIYFFVSSIRPATEQFKNAAGIFYQDRFVPLAEAVLNAIACLIFGYKYGIAGVVAGNIFSTVAIISWQKPYMTFKYVFKTKLSNYFKDLLQYVAIGCICLIVTREICQIVIMKNLWLTFFIQIMISIVLSQCLLFLFFCRTRRFKEMIEFGKKLLRNSVQEQNNL